MKTVKEIGAAEEEYDRIIHSARDRANKVIQDAKEKALRERTKAEEGIVAFKNERLRQGSESIEAEVRKLVDKAKADAATFNGRNLDAQSISKIVRGFLASAGGK